MSGPFEQLVFSGGGTRCFWQGGFLHAAREPLDLKPERICSISGGAFTGAGFIAHRGERSLEIMGDAFDRYDSNLSPNPFDDTGLTPHQEVYRRVVTETLNGDAIDQIAEGPAFQITLASPPKALSDSIGAALGIGLYKIDKKLRNSPHIALPEAAGFEQIHVDARQAARDGRLIDLICAAATIPPVFDLVKWEGRTVMDAGTCDHAPMPKPDKGETLILLTMDYEEIPEINGRTYLTPRKATPADRIDFTSRKKIEATWDMGIEDAESWIAER